MPEIELSFTTPASADRCYRAARDVRLLAEFMGSTVNSVIELDPDCPGGELVKGRRHTLSAVKNGRPYQLLEVQLESESHPRSVVLTGKQRLQKSYRLEYAIESLHGATAVTLRMSFEPISIPPFTFLLTPFVLTMQTAALGQWVQYLQSALLEEPKTGPTLSTRASARVDSAASSKPYEPIHPDDGRNKGVVLLALAALAGTAAYYWLS